MQRNRTEQKRPAYRQPRHRSFRAVMGVVFATIAATLTGCSPEFGTYETTYLTPMVLPSGKRLVVLCNEFRRTQQTYGATPADPGTVVSDTWHLLEYDMKGLVVQRTEIPEFGESRSESARSLERSRSAIVGVNDSVVMVRRYRNPLDSASTDRAVRVNLTTHTWADLPHPENWTSGVLSPDGRILATMREPGKVHLVNASTGLFTDSVSTGVSRAMSAWWKGERLELLVLGYSDLVVVNSANGQSWHYHRVYEQAFCYGANRAALLTNRSTILLVQLGADTFQVLSKLVLESSPTDISLDSSGRYMAYSTSDSTHYPSKRKLWIWDQLSNGPIRVAEEL